METWKAQLYSPYKLVYENTYKIVSNFDDGQKLPEGWRGP